MQALVDKLHIMVLSLALVDLWMEQRGGRVDHRVGFVETEFTVW